MGVDNKALAIIPNDSPIDYEPDIDAICKFVSDGGTLAKYCKDHGHPFGEVSGWIKENELRKSQYKEACVCRDDWTVQHLSSMLMEIARFDHSSVINDDNTIKPVSEWSPAARLAISEVELVPGTAMVKVKFTPRLKALEMIGKARGMFKQKIELESGQTLSELVLGSMKKEEK